jgi:AcrR family transcriptional regulator
MTASPLSAAIRDTAAMAMTPDRLRRPGYAPAANAGVGRRGLHTRDRILACAAEVFLANGFHGSSLDTIARAANASRATVYQYFAGKEDIFRELSEAAGRDVLAHGDTLGELGPTRAGVLALHRWLEEWADLYDTHAAAFAEYPGIGTAMSLVDAGPVAKTFIETVTLRVRAAGVSGLEADDAAAALTRIPHMLHLYRYRAMFPFPGRAVLSSSLTIALQLMLFPETPAEVLTAVAPRDGAGSMPRPRAVPAFAPKPAELPTTSPTAPTALDVLAVSSSLFAERGYYAVGMEDLATAAGVSRATLYRHFSTKDKILSELTRRAVAEIEEQAAALPRMAADDLTGWMLGYVRFHRTYRGVIRAWFDGTVAEQLSDAAVDTGIGAVRRAVAALLATVSLPAAMDVHVAGAILVAVLGRMSEPTAPDRPDSDEHAAELMATLLRRSLLRES